MAHFLDLDGLQTLWSHIVAKVSAMVALKADLASPALTGTPTAPTAATSDYSTQIASTEFVYNAIAESNVPNVIYATSNTAAGTAAKVVTPTFGNFSPYVPSILVVQFSTANTAATPTLSIDGTAYTIYIGSATLNSTTNTLKWSANTTMVFAFDGTYFRYITASAGGTIVQPEGAGTWYGTSSTAATTAAKVSTIANFRLTPGALVNITFSTANTKADAALTLNINSTGAKTIYSNNAATSATNHLLWSVGETLTFVYSGSYWYFVGKSGSSIGTVVEAAVGTSGTTSVENATATNLTSISLAAGTWVVTGQVTYNRAGTDAAYRACWIGSSATGSQYANTQMPHGSSGNWVGSATAIITLTETSTVYLNTQHGAGQAINAVNTGCKIKAVRIA